MFGKNDKIWDGFRYNIPSMYELDIQNLKFCNKSTNPDPQFALDGDSGFDLRAYFTEDDEKVKKNKETNELTLTLKPFERYMIHTGLYFQLPEYTEIQVRPRSGVSFKEGLTIINTPGTVDEKYRGEYCILAVNLDKSNITITNGDRIAQAVLCPVYNSHLVKLEKVDDVSNDTERGEKGFNSTGVK